MWTVELLVMLAMIVLNGVVAGYEIALTSISVARLQELVREGRAGAKASLAMKRGMERSLATVQLCITLFGAIAAATGGAGAEEAIAPALENAGLHAAWAEVVAIALVVVPLTALTLVFGELAPKVFSLRNNEWVCLRLSPLMARLTGAIWPPVWLLEKSVAAIMNLSERLRGRPWQARREAQEIQELRAMAALARMSQLIGAREEGIIVNAVRLSRRLVREIMLPAADISMLDVNQSLGEALVEAHLDLHTRFPAAERRGDPQTIVGYVNFKDIVACMRLSSHNPVLRSVVRPLPRLSEDLPLSACMEQMIRDHTHIALVVDRQRQVSGMITLEDILEELVGDIQDEYDRMPAHVSPSGTAWVVGGGAPLGRLKELTGIDLAAPAGAAGAAAPKNLHEWAVARLGRPVHGGDVIEDQRVRLIVRSVRRQRLHEAQVEARGAKTGTVPISAEQRPAPP